MGNWSIFSMARLPFEGDPSEADLSARVDAGQPSVLVGLAKPARRSLTSLLGGRAAPYAVRLARPHLRTGCLCCQRKRAAA